MYMHQNTCVHTPICIQIHAYTQKYREKEEGTQEEGAREKKEGEKFLVAKKRVMATSM